MEVASRARAPIRGSITKTIKSLESALLVQPLDVLSIKILQRKLVDLEAKITQFDDKILDALINANPYDEKAHTDASEDIEQYQDEIRAAIVKVESKIDELGKVVPVVPGRGSTASIDNASRRKFLLPKIELRKYSGELKEWLNWWSQFEKIHTDDELDESDKFHYLKQCMCTGTRAFKLVHSYPETKENYPKVIEALRDRFGDKNLLAESYVRKLQDVMLGMSKVKIGGDLSAMYDDLETQLRSLDSLNVVLDKSTFLVPLIEAGLPAELLRVWQRSPDSGYDEDKPVTSAERLPALLKFLRREIKGEERIQLIKGRQVEVRNSSWRDSNVDESLGVGRKRCGLSGNKSPHTSQSLYVASSPCIFCKRGGHNSQDCVIAIAFPLEKKNKLTSEAGACFRCLKRGHLGSRCSAVVKCVVCGKQHYPIMCRQSLMKVQDNPTVENVKNTGQDGIRDSASALTNYNQVSKNNLVLMKTLIVQVKNGYKTMNARLLFDEGSNKSYIKTSAATSLNSPVIDEYDLTTILFGGTKTSTKRKKLHQVELVSLDNKNSLLVELTNEDKICGDCPKIPYGVWIEELNKRNIFINDMGGNECEIKVLIGSDLWANFMTGRMVKLECGLIAVESIFGWTISGKIKQNIESFGNCVISMCVQADKSLTNLWSLETLGIRDPIEKETSVEHEQAVLKRLEEGLKRDDEGRYVVRLPWVEGHPVLSDNKACAIKRLESITKKLNRENQYETYNKVFQEWLQEGIIELHKDEGKLEHFLPHRPVFKTSSTTTPVRPVFDASAHERHAPSLNQCVETGPNLLELIPSILLRFRKRKIGVLSDIRKAFLMIGVDGQDRSYQKFLWWNEAQKDIIVLRHCRVVFGMSCSPFILAAVLNHHLSCVDADLSETAKILKSSLYVDNCVVSLNSEVEYMKFKNEATDILADAKMDLRMWETNIDHNILDDSKGMVLGMLWNKKDDYLTCQIPTIPDNLTINKRTVLSITSGVFDPMGIAAPAILQLKLMLQDSWAQQVGWDEEWPDQQKEKFLAWSAEVEEYLPKIRVPRWVNYYEDVSVQLHLFTDASKDSYAAVVFIRCELNDEVKIHLLMAKSRLSPLSKSRKITIPRLELMGCVIGARMLSTVKEAIQLQNVKTYCWSDSTTALAWIRRENSWGTFVNNRTKEINSLVPKSQWRHVPGNLNPADLPSRGCSLKELAESRWAEGPVWLSKNENQWPISEEKPNEDLVTKEIKIKTVVNACMEPIKLRFSCYVKNIKVQAWVIRFINNLKKKAPEREMSKILTPEEILNGEKILLLKIQKTHSDLTNTNLNVMKGDDQLIRVKTRLNYRDDSETFKYPILLPGSHPLVRQLIEFVHKALCHAGPQLVLSKLREHYWITQGKKSVSNVIIKCVLCRRFSAKKMIGAPAPLPPERVQTTYAFQTTGVDLAGPIILKGGKKTWIVIYTCAVYRGVYLDLIDSLSTEEFLVSLNKFTCNIGRPSVIFSDCGTNFVGSKSLMEKLDWKKLEAKLGVSKLRWKMNPPTSAWWGGWWERLIRIMKDLLKRMLGTAKLTRKELLVCLCEVAQVMNDRPLTRLSEDPDDLTPLTPALFMRDLPVSGLPEFNKIVGGDLRSAYQKILNIKEALKARFRKEYLANLVSRGGGKMSTPPEVGDIVLIGSDNKKRFEWPLGRILELLPGKDGHTRLCRLRTAASGNIIRPIQRLYQLEVREEKIQLPESSNIEPAIVPLNDTDPPVLVTRSGRAVKSPKYSSWKN